jgi:hypothetical protein
MQEAPSRPGVSFRAVCWGCSLSLAACMGALHSTFISASWMALNISVPIALFVFFLFAGLVHPLLGLIHRQLSLQRAELGVVFIMVMMAATVPTEGFVEHLLPKIVSVFYYATPENEWVELIHPHVKPWIAPQDEQAVRYFFEGLPQGFSIPWGVWIRPLFYWSLFFLVLCFVMFCLAVILRRQWMEHERLVYPLVKLPLEMLAGGASARLFYRSVPMWLGFFIPFTLLSLEALHSYFNIIPAITLNTSIPLISDIVDLPLSISFMTLGFSYFVNLQVLLSIWLFYLVIMAQQGLFSLLGIAMVGQLTGYATAEAIAAHEGMGAMIAFVLFSLWVARGHLRAVGRKAFLGAVDVDDSEEMLSYRTAVLGSIAGLVILGVWLTLSGLPGWLVPWFLFVVFVLYVGLSRFVAEAGLATIRAPIYPQAFMSSSVGTAAIGSEGLVALGLTYGWILKVRVFSLAACANVLKLDEQLGIGGSKRRLFLALALAVVTSLLFSYWFLLKQVYTYGGINMNRYFFALSENPYIDVSGWIVNPTTVNWEGWFYVGMGGAVTVLLVIARHYLLWWPLHPVGLPIATTWVAHQIWLSIFLVWLFKGAVLRYGGPGVYRRIQPFFLGLILGNVTAGGVWLLIDGFTGMQGNILVYY